MDIATETSTGQVGNGQNRAVEVGMVLSYIYQRFKDDFCGTVNKLIFPVAIPGERVPMSGEEIVLPGERVVII